MYSRTQVTVTGPRRNMEEWIKECITRRNNGSKVEVRDAKGKIHQLGGLQVQKRHFFGLCPSCLKIGEHSSCSGREATSQEDDEITLFRLSDDVLLF